MWSIFGNLLVWKSWELLSQSWLVPVWSDLGLRFFTIPGDIRGHFLHVDAVHLQLQEQDRDGLVLRVGSVVSCGSVVFPVRVSGFRCLQDVVSREELSASDLFALLCELRDLVYLVSLSSGCEESWTSELMGVISGSLSGMLSRLESTGGLESWYDFRFELDELVLHMESMLRRALFCAGES